MDTTTRLGFGVTAVKEVVESARQLTEVVSEPKQTQWGQRAVVRDADGRAVELYGEYECEVCGGSLPHDWNFD